MRKLKKCIAFVLVCLLCLCCFSGCLVMAKDQKSEHEKARIYIEQKSKVEIPSDAQAIYLIRKETEGFNFYKFQYAVFQFESEPSVWLKASGFINSSIQEESDEFKSSFSTMMNTWLPKKYEGQIPQEYLPNFDNFYYYFVTPYQKYYINNVYFVYLPESLMLITMLLSPA